MRVQRSRGSEKTPSMGEMKKEERGGGEGKRV